MQLGKLVVSPINQSHSCKTPEIQAVCDQGVTDGKQNLEALLIKRIACANGEIGNRRR
jgi:hypothetical protein